jgi:hypothetical protein
LTRLNAVGIVVNLILRNVSSAAVVWMDLFFLLCCVCFVYVVLSTDSDFFVMLIAQIGSLFRFLALGLVYVCFISDFVV